MVFISINDKTCIKINNQIIILSTLQFYNQEWHSHSTKTSLTQTNNISGAVRRYEAFLIRV